MPSIPFYWMRFYVHPAISKFLRPPSMRDSPAPKQSSPFQICEAVFNTSSLDYGAIHFPRHPPVILAGLLRKLGLYVAHYRNQLKLAYATRRIYYKSAGSLLESQGRKKTKPSIRKALGALHLTAQLSWINSIHSCFSGKHFFWATVSQRSMGWERWMPIFPRSQLQIYRKTDSHLAALTVAAT